MDISETNRGRALKLVLMFLFDKNNHIKASFIAIG